MTPAPPAHPDGTLGILAGGGEVPIRVARAAIAAGRPAFAVLIEGWADPIAWAGLPHQVERVGAAARILGALRAQGARQIVMTGSARRPTLASIRPDAAGVRLLAKLSRAFLLGDDGLLRGVSRMMEEEGFEVVGVDTLLSGLFAAAGLLTRTAPDATALGDITRGVAVAQVLGAADVGQCAVVQQGVVLAVEAIEGTDAMLARCAALRREGPGGVLVKLVKPGQDRRLDMPTIGPGTVAAAAAAGLAGIAIEAGGTILVDRAATIAAADAAGIFLLALRPGEFTANEESTA